MTQTDDDDGHRAAEDWFERLVQGHEFIEGQKVIARQNLECPARCCKELPEEFLGEIIMVAAADSRADTVFADRHYYAVSSIPAEKMGWFCAQELEPLPDPDPARVAMPFPWHQLNGDIVPLRQAADVLREQDKEQEEEEE